MVKGIFEEGNDDMKHQSNRKKKIRVLHLPTLVGSNASFLSMGEKEQNVESKIMVYGDISHLNQKIYDYNINSKSRILKNLKLWLFFVYALFKFDLFHYNFGSTTTILSARFFKTRMHAELLILKIFRKKIVVTYQGDDARQKDYCLEHHQYTYFRDESFMKKESNDHRKRVRIAIFDKYADLIYTLNPDLLSVLPKRTKFRAYTQLDIVNTLPVYTDNYEKLKIIHAPSNRAVKGTDLIIKQVGKLKAEGYDFDFTLIENMPIEEALKAYEEASLVVDQLYAGWYGGFSVEVMALGKPVMCYIREGDLAQIPQDMAKDLPIINTNPDRFYSDLKAILDQPLQLKPLAIQSRKFTEKWHDIHEISKSICEDYHALYQ